MNFCGKCGTKIQEGSKFCGKCGSKLSTDFNSNYVNEIKPESRNFSENNNTIKKFFDGATEKINKYTGETDVVEVNLKDLFSEVTKKHTQEEAEKIFISGTSSTTPSINEVSENFIKPWLFSRVFLLFFVAFVVMWYAISSFQSVIAVPGFILLGAFTMPLTALIFFFESNSLRNISILKTMEMFFVGGVFSIIFTFILHEIFPVQQTIFGELTTSGAFTVGFVEETAKLLLVMYFVNKFKVKYILNGLLIGCAVGAGFAAFETAGYILAFANDALSVTFIRAITAVGGHLAWTALAGGALVMVKKNDDISLNHILNSNFLFFFISSVVMHAVWDMEIPIITNPYLKICILVVLVWIEIFVLMSAGLKEVHRIKRNI